ncbi:CsgE family curli-type amyloid fiber assembly protein [Olleya marilimosa]|uniref:Curli production assembly/transport component CsgE n=1 Tax=Olleya marilimosa TaxID=272164 RepID=A0ABR8LTC1_9FLAO|nr:CsgE family curli-type amyloid fiber assembly protein [Olleya marilimosa]MBD3863421.1 hypothetical protein [Olleya marilimosa]
MVLIIVFFFTINAYSQSYNTQVEARLIVTQDNNIINIKGVAINKMQLSKSISYKLSVFKTDKNQNKSKNEQSGQLDLNADQQKDLSTTSINFDQETKVIILLLIFDSTDNIIGKDRIVYNDNEDNTLTIKKNIAEKIEDISVKISAQLVNNEVEAKIETAQQNDFTTIKATAFNKTEITKSLIFKLMVFDKEESVDNLLENKKQRFIISANQKIELAEASFNSVGDQPVICVMLIYDLDNNLIGQDRVVYNDKSNLDIKNKQKLLEKLTEEQANSKDVNRDKRDGLELKGIVVEDTKTKPGRDFYKLFYSLYTQNNINGNKVVTIKEVLALGRNTKIEVIVGDDEIFSFFVRPSLEYLTKMNDYAIINVYKHFKKLENESKTIKRY